MHSYWILIFVIDNSYPRRVVRRRGFRRSLYRLGRGLSRPSPNPTMPRSACGSFVCATNWSCPCIYDACRPHSRGSCVSATFIPHGLPGDCLDTPKNCPTDCLGPEVSKSFVRLSKPKSRSPTSEVKRSVCTAPFSSAVSRLPFSLVSAAITWRAHNCSGAWSLLSSFCSQSS